MIIIGNDIVDLAQAKQDSDWRRPGYLAKTFTAHEQQLIGSASNPDQMVWLLWSMKESAYKIAVRQTGKRVFAPLKLVCQLHSSPDGEVAGTVFYGACYQTKSVVTDRYVTTVAYASGVPPAFCQVIVPLDNTTYLHQHRAIRADIKQRYAALLAVPEYAVSIQKDTGGAPSLCIRTISGQTVCVPVSLSHHGHYGAYVVGDWPAYLIAPAKHNPLLMRAFSIC